MKKTFLMALAITTLTACRKDDDKSSKIVGTWKPVKHITVDGNSGAILETELIDECEKKGRIYFYNDGKFKANSFEKNDETASCEELPKLNGTYTYNDTNKKVIITTDEGSETNDIVKITNTELQVLGEQEDENGDGVLDSYISVFEKVN